MINNEVGCVLRGRTDVRSHLSRALRILCAAAVLATSGCSGFEAERPTLYHNDPASVRERYEGWVLFAYLGNALQAVAAEDFGRSSEQLAAVRIDRTHLPSSMLDLASRYFDLCSDLSATIENLYEALAHVERLLDVNDLQRASVVLTQARSSLSLAREQLEALEQATLEVFALLRRSGSGGSTAQLEEARRSLDAALALLLQLTLEYEQRLEQAETAAELKHTLQQPDVALQLQRDFAWVGESIGLRGRMLVGSSPLADREIVIMLDGFEAIRCRTGADGRFSCELSVPYDYVPRRMVQAVFQPAGADLDRYRPAHSPELVLTVRYHQSVVVLELPQRVYPGLPFEVSGTVTSPGGVAARGMTLQWHSHTIGETATDASGTFTFIAVLPDAAAEGVQPLVVTLYGDDSTATAPETVDTTVEVRRAAPQLRVSAGPLLFVPSPSLSLLRQITSGDFVRPVRVSGEIRSSLPLEVPAMTASWGDRQSRWQQQGTVIEHDVSLVVSVWSMGVRTLTLRATPLEPWHRPVEARAHLLVVNLFVPLVWLVALGLALLLGFAVRRSRMIVAPLPVASAPTATVFPMAHAGPASRASVGEEVDSSPRISLVRAYYAGVRLMQSTLGLVLRREMTLREYFAATSMRMPGIARAFGRLTSLAEQALYGRREPGHDEVSLGRRILNLLRHRVTAHGGDAPGERR